MAITRKDALALRWLRDNPGSWGGHLERDEPCRSPDMRRWITAGLIEVRPHEMAPGGRGYFLTDSGHTALNREEADRG